VEKRLIKDDWLTEYLRYTSEHQAPQKFHRWIGISLIASALERNTVLDMKTYKVYPNFYVILLAESGVCNKTGAMDMGNDILIRLRDKTDIFAQKITPEAIIQRLARRCKMQGRKVIRDGTSLIYASELSVFLGKEIYNIGITGILISLYDGRDPFKYETKHGGVEVVRNPLINLIGATTPRWLKTGVFKDSLGEGLVERMIFIYASAPRHWKAFQEATEYVETNLIHDLNLIRKEIRGQFGWEEDAKKWFKNWYEEELPKECPSNKALMGFFSRKHTNVLKIAMILSASHSSNMLLKCRYLIEALRIINDAEKDMGEAIKAMEETSRGAELQSVLEYIRRKGEVDRSQLLRAFDHKLTAKEITEIIDTLTDAKLIDERSQHIEGGRGKSEKMIYTPVEFD